MMDTATCAALRRRESCLAAALDAAHASVNEACARPDDTGYEESKRGAKRRATEQVALSSFELKEFRKKYGVALSESHLQK